MSRRLDNMGAVTKEEMEKFAGSVLGDFPKWSVKWTTAGGICMFKTRIVYIDERYIGKYPWDAKEHILHEFAHINTWPKDQGHGRYFYNEYVRLLKKFMVGEGRDE